MPGQSMECLSFPVEIPDHPSLTLLKTVAIYHMVGVTNCRLNGLRLVLRATGGSTVCQINRRQVRRKECNVCVCVCMYA